MFEIVVYVAVEPFLFSTSFSHKPWKLKKKSLSVSYTIIFNNNFLNKRKLSQQSPAHPTKRRTYSCPPRKTGNERKDLAMTWYSGNLDGQKIVLRDDAGFPCQN